MRALVNDEALPKALKYEYALAGNMLELSQKSASVKRRIYRIIPRSGDADPSAFHDFLHARAIIAQALFSYE